MCTQCSFTLEILWCLDLQCSELSTEEIFTFICPSVRTAGCPCGRCTEGAGTVTGAPGWIDTVWGAACGCPCVCTWGYGLTTMVSCFSSLKAKVPPLGAGGWSCWLWSASRLLSPSATATEQQLELIVMLLLCLYYLRQRDTWSRWWLVDRHQVWGSRDLRGSSAGSRQPVSRELLWAHFSICWPKKKHAQLFCA